MNYFDFVKTWQPFDEYRVKIAVKMLSGGIPKHPDLIQKWIDTTNKKKSEEERAKLVEATIEELGELGEDKASRSWTGFKEDETGLYLEGRCVKAMLKESANIIKDVAPTRKSKKAPKGIGITAFKSKMADHVFVVEEKVYIKRDGAHITKILEHEQEERPIHVMTPQGPRTSLKRTDVVRNIELEFTIKRLDNTGVTEKSLYAAISFAACGLGVGSGRSQGSGDFEVISMEQSAESCLPIADD